MEKKLYVGNIPYHITEDQLHELFAAQGNVKSTRLIIDKYSGRSKGFGFVEMATEAEAKTAMDKLNGHDIEGKNLRINEARPMENRPNKKFSGGFKKKGGFNRW